MTFIIAFETENKIIFHDLPERASEDVYKEAQEFFDEKAQLLKTGKDIIGFEWVVRFYKYQGVSFRLYHHVDLGACLYFENAKDKEFIKKELLN